MFFAPPNCSDSVAACTIMYLYISLREEVSRYARMSKILTRQSTLLTCYASFVQGKPSSTWCHDTLKAVFCCPSLFWFVWKEVNLNNNFINNILVSQWQISRTLRACHVLMVLLFSFRVAFFCPTFLEAYSPKVSGTQNGGFPVPYFGLVFGGGGIPLQAVSMQLR